MNSERGRSAVRTGHAWAAGAYPSLAGASILAIVLPLLGMAIPRADMAVAVSPASPGALRMVSKELSTPMIVGRRSGNDLNSVVRILNILNREVDVELQLIRSGEAAPTLVLQHRLGKRELLSIDGSSVLGGNNRLADRFTGAATISSDTPIAATFSLSANDDGGLTGPAYAKPPAGSSVLTQILGGDFETLFQLISFQIVPVQFGGFFNNDQNVALGNVNGQLGAGGNSTRWVGDVLPNPVAEGSLSMFAATNGQVGAGSFVLDPESSDWHWSPAVRPGNAGKDFFLPAPPDRQGQGTGVIIQNHSAMPAELLLKKVDGAGNSAEQTIEVPANQMVDVDDDLFKGLDFVAPRRNYVGARLRFRGSEEPFISAVVTTDQRPASRSVASSPHRRGITAGNYHTLVPGWTDDYAASKRAVAMGAIASDSSTVTFCALNIGPKTARIKVVVRRADGSRVFSTTINVGPNQTVDVPFPRRAKGDDLYVDARISKSGPVFTYLLEERDTGEINYIPGIAVK